MLWSNSVFTPSGKPGREEHMSDNVETSSAVGSGIVARKVSISLFACGVRNAPGGFGAVGGAGVTVLQGVGSLCSARSV